MECEGELDTLVLASHLYKKAKDLKYDVNRTKLQKLVYICYGVYLSASGRCLPTTTRLLKERPLAYLNGPIFLSLLRFTEIHSLEILELHRVIILTNLQDQAINATLKAFGKWSTYQLMEYTSREGRAWSKTRSTSTLKYNAPVDDGYIIDDFKKILKKS